MSGPLRTLNTALALVACLLAVGLSRELLAALPLPPQPAPRPARPVTAAVASSATASPSGPGYGIIVTKNLFSVSRSEAPASPAAAAGPKPVLHGIVADGPRSRAYLEDPVVKRTFGYAVGDALGGGRVESIAADRVVIGRGDGSIEVLLHDPSKPRPTLPAPVPAGGPQAGGAPSGPATASPATSPPTEPAATPQAAAPGLRAER